jgi:uncharacterized protein (DUF4415 family)
MTQQQRESHLERSQGATEVRTQPLTRPQRVLSSRFEPNSAIGAIMSRRPIDPRAAAERAFKAVTSPKPVELPPKSPSLPNVKETVTLRIDRDVLDFFQEGGPGWQDRISAALRKAAGK